MRFRTTWCITLILLCHHPLQASGVMNELPQAVPANPIQAEQPQQQAAPQKPSPAPQPGETPGAPSGTSTDAMPAGDTPLTPGPDPAFAQPVPTPEPASTPPPAAAPAEPAPLPVPILLPTPTSDVVNTGIAIPIDAPPPGTPVHIEATHQGKAGDTYTLDGDTLILYKSYRVRADHAVYNTATATVDATGHVTVDGGPSDEHMVADHGTMNLDAHTAHFYDATGTLGVRSVTHDRFVFTAPNPFALTGREVLQLGPGRYQVLDGSLTSCRLPDPDWHLLARRILVENNVAHARNSTFTLFHAPVFFLPYVSHPVEQNHRQSGLLLPIFGDNTQKGIISGESAYLVLGRSADATVGSEYFSARGFAPFGQIRYRGLGENFAAGRFRALLDRQPHNLPPSQGGYEGGVEVVLNGKRQLDADTRAVADVDYLSSYVYRQVFEENYSSAINSEVHSSAYLIRERDGFAATGRFERYQNFRSTNPGDEIKVLHVPELHLDAIDQPLGRTLGRLPLLWGGEASADALSRAEPGFVTTTFVPRLDVFPHLALPLSADGWTLRSEAGFRETFYGKSQQPGIPGSVPVAELGQSLNRAAFLADVSLHTPTLERDYSSPLVRRWFGGGELRHTIEPELSWHYVTGVNHFASTLRFDEADALTDTNEVEYGLTQRIFLRHLHAHPCKGDEALGPSDTCGGGTTDWLTWTVAQRYYLNPTFGGAVVAGQRNVFASTLDLTGVAFLSNARNNSPVVSRLRVRTTRATDLEWDLDYDVHSGRLSASNVFASYRLRSYFFSVGDSRLFNLLPQVTSLPNAPNPNTISAESAFNQLHLAAIYGSPTKHGLSAGLNLGYDVVQGQAQYLGAQAGYNRDCCGIAFETRKYAFGNNLRNDTQYLFSFTLAGVGSAGSLSPGLRVF